MPNIEVSRSTFTITSILPFKDVLEQFENLSTYLVDFFDDLMKPERLTILRTGQVLPDFLTSGNTHIRAKDTNNRLPPARNNPWCNDTFIRHQGQMAIGAKLITDVYSLHECEQVCLSEPTCEYYTFYARQCSMGFRGHDSSLLRVKMSHTKNTGALYARKFCENQTFEGMTLEEMIKQKEVQCQDFQCEAVRQYLDLLSEIKYSKDVYNTMYGNFLSAIGRGSYFSPRSAVRRANHSETKDLKAEQLDLSTSEATALESLLHATQSFLDKHRAYDNGTHTRLKRFSVTDLLFGWGIGAYTSYRNAMTLAAINKNVNQLQAQNQLQEDQIQELASNVELTMEHVNLNQEAIKNLDERLLQAEYAIKQMKEHLEYIRLVWSITSSTRTAITRVQSALHAMRNNMEYVFKVIDTMATRRITPTVIPKERLLKILHAVEKHLGSQPRLSLPRNPQDNIWQYYDLIRVTPIMTSDMIIMMLSFPLTDKALDLQVYRVHQFPALHPELREEFTYNLEGQYLGVTADGDFAALITQEEIQLCQSTDDYLCTLNSALYPTDSLGWCVYQLFSHNEDMIARHCKVDHSPHHTPKVISLGGYAWAVSSLITSRVDIQCYAKEHRVNIEPPLTIIYVANGCHAYSSQFKIPAKTDLTTMQEFFPREEFLTKFNKRYQSYHDYHLWGALEIDQLTPEEIDKMRIHLPTLGAMTMEHLKKHIKPIDKVKVWVPKAWQVLLGMIFGFLVVSVVIFLLAMWVKDKYKDLAKYKTGFAASALELTGNIARQTLSKDPKRSLPTGRSKKYPSLCCWKSSTSATTVPPAPPGAAHLATPAPAPKEEIPLTALPSTSAAEAPRGRPLPLTPPPPPSVAEYDSIDSDDEGPPSHISTSQIAGVTARLIRQGELSSLTRKVQQRLAKDQPLRM